MTAVADSPIPSRALTPALTPPTLMSEASHVLYVRRAKPADIPWLMIELRKFSEFFGTTKPLFPKGNHASLFLLDLIERQPFFIAAHNGHPIGLLAASLGTHPYNPEIQVLSELFWWVTEDQRGGRAAVYLIEKFLEFGERHADWITFSDLPQSPLNERSLLKRGFRLHERSYLKEVAR